MISYMADFSLWRFDAFGYHLTNVFLHIMVSLSVFFLFNMMTRDRRIAFFGALFYGLHPAHTAAVTYIAGRADPLAALFSLLSVILLHLHFNAGKRTFSVLFYALSVGAFLTALLSKELALVLPAVILAYSAFFVSDVDKERSRRYLRLHYISAFLVILGVYMVLRVTALDFQNGAVIARQALYVRAIASVKAIAAYLGIIFMPVKLHMERDIAYTASLSVSALVLSSCFIASTIWLASKIKKISYPAFFGIIFFFITLFPVLNIYPLHNNFAEHWLYMPMIGVSLSVICLIAKLWDSRKITRPFLGAILVLYLVFFSARTFVRNFDWRDELTIYTHTYRNSPSSIKMINNLGNLYNASGDFAKAAVFHKKALEINPKEHKTLLNLGIDYEAMGLIEEAFAQYRASAFSRPDYAKAYFHMGNIHVKRGKLSEAVSSYLVAIKLDKFFLASHTNLGNTYFAMGDYISAKREYDEAIAINPYSARARNNLGSALTRLGIYDEAIAEYRKAIGLDPDDWEYYLNLGAAYGELSIFDDAIEMLTRAHQLNPGSVDPLINLGVAYYYIGNIELAKNEWEKALLIDPDNPIALAYLSDRSLP